MILKLSSFFLDIGDHHKQHKTSFHLYKKKKVWYPCHLTIMRPGITSDFACLPFEFGGRLAQLILTHCIASLSRQWRSFFQFALDIFLHNLKWSAALYSGSCSYYVLRVIFCLTFRVSSFKLRSMAYITANRLNLTVVELDSVYLWHLCLLWLKWIQSLLETIHYVVSGRSRVSYSSRELKAIRTFRLRTRLPTEVLECIISLGIQKPNRSKRASHRKKCKIRFEADSMIRGPWNVKNSNQTKAKQSNLPSFILALAQSLVRLTSCRKLFPLIIHLSSA